MKFESTPTPFQGDGTKRVDDPIEKKKEQLKQKFLERNVQTAWELVSKGHHGYEDGVVYESESAARAEADKLEWENSRAIWNSGNPNLRTSKPYVREIEKPKKKTREIKTREGIWTEWGD